MEKANAKEQCEWSGKSKMGQKTKNNKLEQTTTTNNKQQQQQQ